MTKNRFLFNVLVGNTDGHAKNISLLQDERGRWRVAPAYDLLGPLVLGYHPGLAFTIGEQANSQQLLSRDWRAFARECGFGYPLVKREIDRLVQRLEALLASEELFNVLQEAGMSEHGWSRLQQQRHHIAWQCRRADGW